MEIYVKAITIAMVMFCSVSNERPQHHIDAPKCRFLPLRTTQRRIGTCCLLPGKHNRIFEEEVVVQEPERPPDEESPPPAPSAPTCDVHAFIFRDKFIGKCCSFVGGAFFRLRSVLRPHFRPEHHHDEEEEEEEHHGDVPRKESNYTLLEAHHRNNETNGGSNRTEEVETTTSASSHTTTESEVPDISVRLFINSSCREGYVLDSNYNCVEEF